MKIEIGKKSLIWLAIFLLIGIASGYSYTSTGLKAPWFATDDGTFNTSINTYATYPIAVNAENIVTSQTHLFPSQTFWDIFDVGSTHTQFNNAAAQTWFDWNNTGMYLSVKDVTQLSRVWTDVYHPGSGSGSNVTGVTATAPLTSSGGTYPNIAMTTPLAITYGGTGASTAAAARTNLDTNNASNLVSGILNRSISITTHGGTASQGLVPGGTNTAMTYDNAGFFSFPTAGTYGNTSLAAEIVPSGSASNNYVAGYFGTRSNIASGAQIWAINTVTTLEPDFTSIGYGLEVDVNVQGTSGTAVGIGITGVGRAVGLSMSHPTYGLWIDRADKDSEEFAGFGYSNWTIGQLISKTETGILIRNPNVTAIALDNVTAAGGIQLFAVSKDGTISSNTLKGTGNGYACVSAAGIIYRSATACV